MLKAIKLEAKKIFAETAIDQVLEKNSEEF